VLAARRDAQEQEFRKGDERKDIDTVRIAAAATWVSPNPAPTIKTRITRLYSMSFPVCSVASQKSKVSATCAQRQTRRSRNAPN
jgi:hypothetical protein